MKKYLFLLILSTCVFLLEAQTPSIGTTTVIPQNPTTNDFIKIVTNVTTPNQGVLVDKSHTVTAMQIRVKGCYSDGMLTALQTFIDTFMIGQLPPGNYQVLQKAYLSSAQQWCNATDSSFATTTFVVAGIATGLAENKLDNAFSVYPNPSSGSLLIGAQQGEAFIFSASGTLVKKVMLAPDAAVDITDLPQGLYFIRIHDLDKSMNTKFVKAYQE